MPLGWYYKPMSIGPPFAFDPKRFRVLMLNAGFASLQAFAAALQMTPSTMTYIAQGARPAAERQEAIALALKVTAAEIWVPVAGSSDITPTP